MRQCLNVHQCFWWGQRNVEEHLDLKGVMGLHLPVVP